MTIDYPDWIGPQISASRSKQIFSSGPGYVPSPVTMLFTDVTPYESIVISTTSNNVASANPVAVNVQWAVDGGPVGFDNFVIPNGFMQGGLPAGQSAVVPCRGDEVFVTWDTWPNGDPIAVAIAGSSRQVSSPVFLSPGPSNGAFLGFLAAVSIPANGSQSLYTPALTKGCLATLAAPSTSVYVRALSQYFNAGAWHSGIVSTAFAAAPNGATVEIDVPGRPLQIQVVNTAATAEVVSLSVTDLTP